MLEIAIATQRQPSTCSATRLFYEPTTSLEGAEVERFLERVRSLAMDGGIEIVLVNHKLDELYAVCNRVVALVDGPVRIDVRIDEVSQHDVVVAIAGEEAADLLAAQASALNSLAEEVDSPPRSAHKTPSAASVVEPVLVSAGGRRLEVRGLQAPGFEIVTFRFP
jgi:ABC-type sugar transport system ATPase subunit